MDKMTQIKLIQKKLATKGKFNISVFETKENQFIKSKETFFDVMTFGNNAIIQADESIYDWCVENLEKLEAKRIMDGECLFQIESKMREYGKKLCGEHIRYLYLDQTKKIKRPQGFAYKLYEKKQMERLWQHKGFDNALNYKDDVLALAAFYEDELIALAGTDDRMGDMWQIGIDTIPAFRGKGLGVYLVKTLTNEIVKRGAIPYYTTWSPNIASTAIALKSGFFPAWVGYYAVDIKG